jgi:protein O-mannosyl-transferase
VPSNKAKRRTQNPVSSRNRVRLFVLAIVLAVGAVYANSLSAPFIFDDDVAIVSNPAIRSLSGSWSQPRNTPLAGRPVAGLTFALNFAASGLDASAFRITNIVIHIGCALLLFAIIRRTLALQVWPDDLRRAGAAIALASALLWAIHPLTTDAVTYITQRTESLMALLYLATLYAAMRAHTSPNATRWSCAAVGACALGMGCKESMATVPVMVALFDRAFLFASWRDAIASRWRLYLGLALTWTVLVVQLATAPRSGSAGLVAGVSVWTYLLNQTVMIVRYLRLTFWPLDLAITYGEPIGYSLSDVLPYAAVVVALLLATIAASRWSRAAGFVGAWFFVTLAPASSFVPIATEVGAERRMYLPLMAITVAIVAIIHRQRRRMAAAALFLLVAVALGALTIRRNAEYGSWLTLAQTTLERWPTDIAHAAVGGELARLRRDEEALPLLRIGARSDVRARYNLGITLYNLGRYDESIRELDLLVRHFPMREEAPWAHRVIGHAHARMRRWPLAVSHLRTTLTMTPADAEARRLLVDAYNSHGVERAEAQRFDDAIDEFRRALELDEQNASARYNLAAALYDSGRGDESFAHAQQAVSLNPRNADARHLMGKLLALRGRLAESVASFEVAATLSPNDPAIREDLERVRRLRR